jgi:cob(I)alamin adenosyltransferase
MTFKIYTRKGDTGTTQLIGGNRVPKHHLRIETYGTVDELNSWVGVIRDSVSDDASRKTLYEIQDRLFTIGSMLATQPGYDKMKLPELTQTDVEVLEHEIDRMNETLPEMKSFLLPGGHIGNSFGHVARCVCRRAERLVSQLNEDEPVTPMVLQYLNRLSDYLFVLSRWVSKLNNAEEVPWKPRM